MTRFQRSAIEKIALHFNITPEADEGFETYACRVMNAAMENRSYREVQLLTGVTYRCIKSLADHFGLETAGRASQTVKQSQDARKKRFTAEQARAVQEIARHFNLNPQSTETFPRFARRVTETAMKGRSFGEVQTATGVSRFLIKSLADRFGLESVGKKSETVRQKAKRAAAISNAPARERKQKIYEAHQTGISNLEIAEQFGVCVATVQHAIKELAPIPNCTVCQRPMPSKPLNAKYCSRHCQTRGVRGLENNREEIPCKECGKPFSPALTRRRTYCSEPCSTHGRHRSRHVLKKTPRAERMQAIAKLKYQGLGITAIEKETGIPKTTIQRLTKHPDFPMIETETERIYQ